MSERKDADTLPQLGIVALQSMALLRRKLREGYLFCTADFTLIRLWPLLMHNKPNGKLETKHMLQECDGPDKCIAALSDRVWHEHR